MPIAEAKESFERVLGIAAQFQQSKLLNDNVNTYSEVLRSIANLDLTECAFSGQALEKWISISKLQCGATFIVLCNSNIQPPAPLIQISFAALYAVNVLSNLQSSTALQSMIEEREEVEKIAPNIKKFLRSLFSEIELKYEFRDIKKATIEFCITY